jgi:hypothetical protein
MLQEKVRRGTFLVRERVKLKTRIKSILTYQGIKPRSTYGLFARKGVDWLHALDFEPAESYLRIISPQVMRSNWSPKD